MTQTYQLADRERLSAILGSYQEAVDAALAWLGAPEDLMDNLNDDAQL